MQIDSVTQNGEKIKIQSIGSAHFLSLKQEQKIGAENKLTIHFSGAPREALNAPWMEALYGARIIMVLIL